MAPKHYECQEDDEFVREFERVLGESLTSRLNDKVKAPNVDIAIPMNLRGRS